MESSTVGEIKEQYKAWQGAISEAQYSKVFEFIKHLEDTELVFIGCGTSYYLALCGAATYMGITGDSARAVTASDVILYPQTLISHKRKCLAVPISRSGKTTETILAANQIISNSKFETLVLSCNPKSELVRLGTRSLIASDAWEESVVMTKSFTSMLLLIQLMAAHRASNSKFIHELEKLPENGARIIKKCDSIARDIAGDDMVQHFTFLGQGPYYGLACESMLKMKEMSLSVSEAYHSMEFRHGPISILNENTLVVVLLSEASKKQEIKLLKEVREIGAKTLVICESAQGLNLETNYLLELNSGLGDYARLNLYMPIIQLLGYYRALKKGLNPDTPRHLTQVVVLE